MHASNPLQSDLWRRCDWKSSPNPACKQHLDGVYAYIDMDLDLDRVHSDELVLERETVWKSKIPKYRDHLIWLGRKNAASTSAE